MARSRIRPKGKLVRDERCFVAKCRPGKPGCPGEEQRRESLLGYKGNTKATMRSNRTRISPEDRYFVAATCSTS